MPQFVPARGEVLLRLWPDESSEMEDEEPFFLNQCPIAAWRIVAVSHNPEETWAEPVLPAAAEMPAVSCGTVMTALMMPDGTVYDMDGTEKFRSLDAFVKRWRKYYEVRRENRLSRQRESAAAARLQPSCGGSPTDGTEQVP